VQQEDKPETSNRIYQSAVNQHEETSDPTHLRPFRRSAIKLFKLDEKASRPEILLQEVLSWTGGQLLLTQKVCQLLADSEAFIPAAEEAARVQQIVETRLINHWDTQIASEHLKSIQQGLVHNQHCDPLSLLRQYQQIWHQGKVPVDGSPIQAELLNLGLVVQQEDKLIVSNRIYQSVFHQNWIEQELAHLRPFSYTKIKSFKLDEKATRPEIVLEEVLSWTGAQPLLMQKVCQLLADSEAFIPAGEEAARVQQLVETRLINHWDTQIASEHLKSIQQRLISNQQCDPLSLLQLYQQILYVGEVVAHESPVETELLNLGLIVQQEDKLKIANRIYQSVFDLNWVAQELENNLQLSSSQAARTVPNHQLLSENTLIEEKKAVSYPRNLIVRRSLILLGMVILLVLCVNAIRAKFFGNSKAKILFQEANELYDKGKFQEAIAKYNEILNIDSNYYQAWTNRGYALGGLQKYSKMLESCSAATIIEKKAVYAWNCRGEASYNLKQYDQAIAAFDEAIALDSKDPVFWINKTESLLALKKTDQALRVINEAIKLLEQMKDTKSNQNDLAVALSHKGKVLSQKQEYREALKVYDQALAYNPDYFTAQRDRGIALQSLRRYNEAAAQFNQMLQASKLTQLQTAETWYYLGLAFCHSSQIDKGLSALDRSLKIKSDYQPAQTAKLNCTSTQSH
jgi:tetratricopeptide (TPR) repeat protein